MPRSRRPADEGRLIQLVYYGYAAFSRVARALPEGLAYALAHLAGTVAARRSKKRDIVARNIARLTREDPRSASVDKLVVAAYRSYADRKSVV